MRSAREFVVIRTDTRTGIKPRDTELTACAVTNPLMDNSESLVAVLIDRSVTVWNPVTAGVSVFANAFVLSNRQS